MAFGVIPLFHQAVKNGDLNEFKRLINKNAFLAGSINEGMTTLQVLADRWLFPADEDTIYRLHDMKNLCKIKGMVEYKMFNLLLRPENRRFVASTINYQHHENGTTAFVQILDEAEPPHGNLVAIYMLYRLLTTIDGIDTNDTYFRESTLTRVSWISSAIDKVAILKIMIPLSSPHDLHQALFHACVDGWYRGASFLLLKGGNPRRKYYYNRQWKTAVDICEQEGIGSDDDKVQVKKGRIMIRGLIAEVSFC
jgi:hypothetical protein